MGTLKDTQFFFFFFFSSLPKLLLMFALGAHFKNRWGRQYGATPDQSAGNLRQNPTAEGSCGTRGNWELSELIYTKNSIVLLKDKWYRFKIWCIRMWMHPIYNEGGSRTVGCVINPKCSAFAQPTDITACIPEQSSIICSRSLAWDSLRLSSIQRRRSKPDSRFQAQSQCLWTAFTPSYNWKGINWVINQHFIDLNRLLCLGNLFNQK